MGPWSTSKFLKKLHATFLLAIDEVENCRIGRRVALDDT